MDPSGLFKYHVEPDESGRRLDSFIADRLENCSRSQAAALIRRGCIQVDGQNCKPGHKVKSNQQIIARIPVPEPTGLVAESLALNILFEDLDILVLDKPPHMVVHPAAGHGTGTLVHGILYHCPDLEGIGAERRPGIVHRLDKDTSGILVVAKNSRAHHALSAQFKDRSIGKRYLALIHGWPQAAEGQIDMPVGRHPVDRKRMSTQSKRGRDALTLWQVRERFTGSALLEIELKTGRTHQIRVHCLAMGHPIVGDPVYTQRGLLKRIGETSPDLQRVFKTARRQMLHAFRISFKHPADQRLLTFEAPLPEDMAAVLDGLRQLQ